MFQRWSIAMSRSWAVGAHFSCYTFTEASHLLHVCAKLEEIKNALASFQDDPYNAPQNQDISFYSNTECLHVLNASIGNV